MKIVVLIKRPMRNIVVLLRRAMRKIVVLMRRAMRKIVVLMRRAMRKIVVLMRDIAVLRKKYLRRKVVPDRKLPLLAVVPRQVRQARPQGSVAHPLQLGNNVDSKAVLWAIAEQSAE